MAGHETTANSLAWTWYLLSQAPEVEARLHAELDSVLAGRAPTLEDVGNAAAFLCSDLAGGITGEITYVDAGFNTVGMSFPEDDAAD